MFKSAVLNNPKVSSETLKCSEELRGSTVLQRELKKKKRN